MKFKVLLGSGIVTCALVVNQGLAMQVTMQTFASGSSGEYRASPSSDLAWVLNNYVNGATKFTDSNQVTWFGTFCVETDEYFSPGSIYNAALNSQALQGGSNTNSGDAISMGTAYLCSQFVAGNLAGYAYGDVSSALDLQNAIWSLEDEGGAYLTAAYISLLTGQFGSLSEAKKDYEGSAVKVMNLTDPNGGLHQDQLVYVPDGGWTVALLGIGLLGLCLVRCRAKAA
jgi:hypothetical protein